MSDNNAINEFKDGMTEATQDVKSFFKRIGEMLHKIGFWLVTLILLGAILGGYGMSAYQSSELKKAAMLGGMVFENKVYNFSERIK